MRQEKTFFKSVCTLAIPVALQSMLQSSFGMVDQIMIGQLGSVSVAGVGLACKFTSIFTVVVSAVGAVAGIMISQYLGQNSRSEVQKSVRVNLLFAGLLAGAFTLLCLCFPKQIMELYTKDTATQKAAADYLMITAGTFLPVAGATMLSTVLRCMEKVSLPLYASICAALANTGLNYIFIFGKLGFAPMGANGAALATLISQLINLLVMLMLCLRYCKGLLKSDKCRTKFNWRQYAGMLLPTLVCEFMWSLGENVYAAIYGRIGTDSSAAMTLINPIQGLMIGALCGLSQAAGVMVGKKLGNSEYDDAYKISWKLILYGMGGSVILSGLILLLRASYVEIYQVDQVVKDLTQQILVAYALIAPIKVLNMIVSGGIIRSGGKTHYVMAIDLIGTWGVGVPLGLLSAFVWKLSIPYVYFILSLEECVRLVISIFILQSKKWMHRLSDT